MVLLIGFAFLAGIVTILSPCILPVLPVVLSGGLAGGRARPWGVVTGFILSFTVLTLTLSALVQSIGLDPELMRWAAAGIILVFGLVLVVPVLKDRFMVWASAVVHRTAVPAQTSGATGGFGAGLVLGVGLGAVWTPCVGPIMASVITLALSQAVDAAAVAITVAYSLGTSVPLLLIMLGGRSILNRFPWVTAHASGLQRGFGILMMAAALALVTGADRAFSTGVLTAFPQYGAGLTALEDQPSVRAELEKIRKVDADPPEAVVADPLTLGRGAWINSEPLTLGGLRGKVVLVDFWTYSCINCVRTVPYLKAWYQKYRDQGLVIVGVHSPEFAFEHTEANVRRAVGELGVTWPVVQDNGFGIWNAYQNQYWPAHYLYGRDGTLLETHVGEGGYAETEALLARALGTSASPATAVPGVLRAFEGPLTPETYLGYGRGARFASPEEVVTDRPSTYTVPNLGLDRWGFSGTWTIGNESSLGSRGSGLSLRFQGSRVYLVMGPEEAPVRVRVSVDGGPVRTLTVTAEALHTVVDEPGRVGGLVNLEFDGPVRVYAFTFG